MIPPIRGLGDVPFLTYEQIFDNDRLPETMNVVGGGPIGMELAPAYQPISPLLRQRAHNERKEIEAVARHHAHRYAVVPLLREEPIGVAHLLELSGHVETAGSA